MAYDDEVKAFEELVKDFDSTYNMYALSYKLEKGLCDAATNEAKEALESLTTGCLDFKRSSYDVIRMALPDGKLGGTTIANVAGWEDVKTVADEIKDCIDRSGKGLIRVHISDLSMDTIADIAFYTRLVKMQITEEFAEKYRDAIRARKAHDIGAGYRAREYRGWRSDILDQAKKVSREWIKNPVFTSGDMISVQDLRSGRTTLKSLEKFTRTEKHDTLWFTDGTHLYLDSGRISAYGTWLHCKASGEYGRLAKRLEDACVGE